MILPPPTLYQRLAHLVATWRAQGYAHAHYPAIGEILRWAHQPDAVAFQLRPPQLVALETYWYLRLVAGTPTMLQLYAQLFPTADEWCAALRIPPAAWQAAGEDQARLLAQVTNDDHFVARFQLEGLRESATLAYPSYIFALAMGVGKTVLIGALLATEFALALTYPQADFIQNALVFAPGRTILEALRALIKLPYAAILPPHLHQPFAAAVKFIVPQDGERTLPVLTGSRYNVIITNTEKIRIRQEQIRKGLVGYHLDAAQLDRARAEVANLRLQAIASLPHLAIVSDEAHHTYGRAMGDELKKVRKTVDFLATQTTVRCVINTTGTPFFRRHPLPDVVLWYGLAAGIRDGILKPIGDNLITYSQPAGMSEAAAREQTLLAVIQDFFATYGGVTLPDGTPAKLAIYFPKTADLAHARPLIEQRLVELGYAPTLLLEHHTHAENKADFDRFATPQSPHRIALLVDRGVEGWDVPALFACALLRKLKTSNNFVLQAASRCLRQLPGNTVGARIYLSAENQGVLARQLRDTYGESLGELTRAIPSLRPPATVVAADPPAHPRPLPNRTWQPPVQLHLERPPVTSATVQQRRLRLDEATLTPVTTPSEATPVVSIASALDLYTASVELARIYRLGLWSVYDALRPLYGADGLIPLPEWPGLRQQIEAQCYCQREARDG